MRRRGDRVMIINGEYAGHKGTVDRNVYQKTVDYPDGWHNGHHVMLDTGVLVTMRWEKVGDGKLPIRPLGRGSFP